MRVRWTILIALLLAVAPVNASDEQPDTELLEYLGEWEGSDKDWADPMDIQDMNFSNDEKIVTENKK